MQLTYDIGKEWVSCLKHAKRKGAARAQGAIALSRICTLMNISCTLNGAAAAQVTDFGA